MATVVYFISSSEIPPGEFTANHPGATTQDRLSLHLNTEGQYKLVGNHKAQP